MIFLICVITSLIFWGWCSPLKLQGAPLRVRFPCFPLSQNMMICCSTSGGHQSPECAAGHELYRFQEQSLSLINGALLGVPPFRLSIQQVLTSNPNTSSLRILSSFTHLEHTRPCSSASTRSCCCSRRSPSRRTPRTSWWRCCSNTEEWRLNTCLCPEDPGRAPGQLWQKTQRTWGSGSVCHHTSCVIHRCFVTPQSAHAQVAVTSGLLSGSTSQSTRLYSHFFGLQYSMQESRL